MGRKNTCVSNCLQKISKISSFLSQYYEDGFGNKGNRGSTPRQLAPFCSRIRSPRSNSKEAEARLAARRQARYEARNIRLKEIEKKQKEEDENQANHTNHNHVQHPHPLHPGKTLHFFSSNHFHKICQQTADEM